MYAVHSLQAPASMSWPVPGSPLYNNIKIYETFGKDGPVAGMFGTKGKTGLAFIIAAPTSPFRILAIPLADPQQ